MLYREKLYFIFFVLTFLFLRLTDDESTKYKINLTLIKSYSIFFLRKNSTSLFFDIFLMIYFQKNNMQYYIIIEKDFAKGATILFPSPDNILFIFFGKNNHEPRACRACPSFSLFFSCSSSSSPFARRWAIRRSNLGSRRGGGDCLTTPTTCPEKRNTCCYYEAAATHRTTDICTRTRLKTVRGVESKAKGQAVFLVS